MRTIGTLIPFCVAGNSSKLPVTKKGVMKNEALFFTRSSHPILFRFRIIFFKFFQGSLNSAFYQNAGIRKYLRRPDRTVFLALN